MIFYDYIKLIMKEDKERLQSILDAPAVIDEKLLKLLKTQAPWESDFDKEGISYWEKWGSESKFDAEFDVDKNTNNTVI